MNEGRFDRFARRIRPLVWKSWLLALPIAAISYADMLRSMFEARGAWIFLAVCLSHALIWLGLAMLYDHQKETQNPPK